MQPVKLPLLISTLYLLLHTIAPFLGIPDVVIIASWALSPLLVVWMVYRVLKDGFASTQTFDEHFYEDVESARVKAQAVNTSLED